MKNKIIEILGLSGIKNVGFCAFEAVSDRLLDCRAKTRLPENSKTVIMCAFPYKVKQNPPQLLSRYAAIPDYHTLCGERLNAACKRLSEQYPEHRFEHFCDNSPIPEVFAAATAGLGKRGENGLLITEQYGSFVFLGEIVTDLELECDGRYSECDACGKCKAACPMGLDKARCLSNISQKKKLSDAELEALRENGILWGCDICAEACPKNYDAKITDIEEFISGYRDTYSPGEDSADRPYNWRGEEIIKRNYENLTKFKSFVDFYCKL